MHDAALLHEELRKTVFRREERLGREEEAVHELGDLGQSPHCSRADALTITAHNSQGGSEPKIRSNFVAMRAATVQCDALSPEISVLRLQIRVRCSRWIPGAGDMSST